MADLNFNFDASTVEPSAPYEVLPKGQYLAIAIASEMKETKNRTGEYLQITFEVIDGDYKGRKLFERLNIKNVNKTAEDIAQRALSALCRATNVMMLTDSDQLHDIPVVLDVIVEPAKGEYGESNRIKGYSSANGVVDTGAKTQAPPQPKPESKQTQASTPPWKRK